MGKIRNGTLVNGGQLVPGVVGNAIELNDTNDEYIDYGPIHEPCFDDMDQCTDGFTLTFWTNTFYTPYTTVPIGLGCGKLGNRLGLRIEIGGNMLLVNVRFSDEYQVGLFTLNPPIGWIHHGVTVRKGQNPQYIMNGTVVPSLATALTSQPATSGGSVRIGAYSERSDVVSFDGKINDVRLWKKAKCPEFIKYIFDMYKN